MNRVQKYSIFLERDALILPQKTKINDGFLILISKKWKYYTLHNTAVLGEEMINLHFDL